MAKLYSGCGYGVCDVAVELPANSEMCICLHDEPDLGREATRQTGHDGTQDGENVHGSTAPTVPRVGISRNG